MYTPPGLADNRNPGPQSSSGNERQLNKLVGNRGRTLWRQKEPAKNQPTVSCKETGPPKSPAKSGKPAVSCKESSPPKSPAKSGKPAVSCKETDPPKSPAKNFERSKPDPKPDSTPKNKNNKFTPTKTKSYLQALLIPAMTPLPPSSSLSPSPIKSSGPSLVVPKSPTHRHVPARAASSRPPDYVEAYVSVPVTDPNDPLAWMNDTSYGDIPDHMKNVHWVDLNTLSLRSGERCHKNDPVMKYDTCEACADGRKKRVTLCFPYGESDHIFDYSSGLCTQCWMSIIHRWEQGFNKGYVGKNFRWRDDPLLDLPTLRGSRWEEYMGEEDYVDDLDVIDDDYFDPDEVDDRNVMLSPF